MIFEAGPALIRTDVEAAALEVRHAAADRSVVNRFGLGSVSVGRTSLDWESRELRRDADEVEIDMVAGDVRVQLRQSFVAGWTTRLVVANEGTEPVEVDDVVFAVDLATGVTPWLVCTGSEACLAVLAHDAGPILAARVTAGQVIRALEDELHTGPIRLPAGSRWMLRLQWDWYASVTELATRLPVTLPRRTVQRDGVEIAVPVDPDTALSWGDGVVSLGEEDGSVLLQGGSGLHHLQLRSARGVTDVALRWAVEELSVLDEAVRELLDRPPRTSAGVVRIGSLAEALVMQWGIVSGRTDQPEGAAEALDLFSARLLANGPGPDEANPWCALYCAAEYQRLGDPDVLDLGVQTLDRAVGLAGRAGTVPAGLGLATTRICLALLLAGRSFAAPLAAVTRLTQALRVKGADDPCWLEGHLATERLAARRDPDPDGPWRGLIGLGRRLGAGLPGMRAWPLPDSRQAHLVAVLRMVPDDLGPRLAQDWGILPAELAERAALEVADRISGLPVAGAHAWLAVADPAG